MTGCLRLMPLKSSRRWHRRGSGGCYWWQQPYRTWTTIEPTSWVSRLAAAASCLPPLKSVPSSCWRVVPEPLLFTLLLSKQSMNATPKGVSQHWSLSSSRASGYPVSCIAQLRTEHVCRPATAVGECDGPQHWSCAVACCPGRGPCPCPQGPPY